MKRVILIGYFQEMVELCRDCGMEIVGVIDNKPIPERVHYLGKDSEAETICQMYPDVNVVITPDAPRVRRRLVEYYRSVGFSFATVIHPTASISPTAQIGEGTVIQRDVNVSANTRVGAFCKLNTRCNVMHDNLLGDYSTVAPNAVLLGCVTLGENCYVGANCTVLPTCSIGVGATIGAGAVVTKNVDPSVTVVGVPARVLHK